jgi:hypothetical protein
MNKRDINILSVFGIIFILMIFGLTRRRKTKVGQADILEPVSNAMSGQCVEPVFGDVTYSGYDCAGNFIDESKTLELGMQGCEVLLLQTRLNSIEPNQDILPENGFFGCSTKAKLTRVVGTPTISLNNMQPDEQTGFNEFRCGTQVNNYSYMDVNE